MEEKTIQAPRSHWPPVRGKFATAHASSPVGGSIMKHRKHVINKVLAILTGHRDHNAKGHHETHRHKQQKKRQHKQQHSRQEEDANRKGITRHIATSSRKKKTAQTATPQTGRRYKHNETQPTQ